MSQRVRSKIHKNSRCVADVYSRPCTPCLTLRHTFRQVGGGEGGVSHPPQTLTFDHRITVDQLSQSRRTMPIPYDTPSAPMNNPIMLPPMRGRFPHCRSRSSWTGHNVDRPQRSFLGSGRSLPCQQGLQT